MARGGEVVDLLDQFVALEGAGQVCARINERRAALSAVLEEDLHPLWGTIAGNIFALFAYNFQRTRADLLLNPRTTLNFYSRTSGKPKILTREGMGLDESIEGISVPDGIQLKYDEVQGIRRVRKLHKYRATPLMTDEQIPIMRALLDKSKLLRNLGIDQHNGHIRTGRTLGGLMGDRDFRPVVLLSEHVLQYTVPENSALLQGNLPPRVEVEPLPIHSKTLRALTRVVVGETLARNLVVPAGPNLLR